MFAKLIPYSIHTYVSYYIYIDMKFMKIHRFFLPKAVVLNFSFKEL